MTDDNAKTCKSTGAAACECTPATRACDTPAKPETVTKACGCDDACLCDPGCGCGAQSSPRS